MYVLVKRLPLFAWLPEIVRGFKQENMNIDKDGDAALSSKLALVQDERNALDGDDAGLSSVEVDNIKEFFNADIKNRPANSVLKVFNRMFKDLKNSKLKKYLMQSVSQVQGLTFTFIADLVLVFCKQGEDSDRLEFLFDIFSKQQSMMLKTAIKDFIDIFKLQAQAFRLATFLTKEQFLAELEDVTVDYSPIEQAKPMILAMTAVIPANDDEERDAVLAAFNGNRNLESFIYENLPEETEYYVIEKKFWDQWCTSMSFLLDD